MKNTMFTKHDIYDKDIGKTFLSSDGKIKGVVKTISERYCAACQCTHTCYIVDWEDGVRTKPCTAGVRVNPGGTLQIM